MVYERRTIWRTTGPFAAVFRTGQALTDELVFADRVTEMRIAYIGQHHGSSLDRARALERLGHTVTIVDVLDSLVPSRLFSMWLYQTSGLGLQSILARYLFRRTRVLDPDLVWVVQGAYLGPKVIRSLRELKVPIVNFLSDNPFVDGTEWRRFRNYRRAILEYDLVTACRDTTAAELAKAGARNVVQLHFAADEITHRPIALSDEDRQRFSSDVAFIGTWMPERGPLLAELVKLNVPLAIWGDRWQKAPEWPILRSCWRGPGLFDGHDYAKAIQCAKICLGLLNSENEDLHTQRSVEVPALGGLLCAKRTSDHEALYVEGEEAVFWNDAEECAAICTELLADESRRKNIARKGHMRAQANGHYNEVLCTSVVDKALQSWRREAG